MRPSGRRDDGLLPVLSRAVRGVEQAVQRGRVRPSTRTSFQVVALLVREERTRIRTDTELSESRRGDQQKRLDAIATALATCAARDGSLLALLTDESPLPAEARLLKREMQAAAGVEPTPEPAPAAGPAGGTRLERRVVPQSVISRQLANPFLEPDWSAPPQRTVQPRLLATWELLGPLLRAFESAAGGASSCMPLPPAGPLAAAGGRHLMPHQAQVVASAADGHRSYLLADEPGLGKTAQALLAAEAADAYPLLVVVPNVVKTNWAREAGLWTPRHPVSVITGDGDTLDGFSDIMVVNYEVLDRHVGWLGDLGFRGMVVDEAHYIKNRASQRSRHVLEIAARIRARSSRALLMALTGTPLINDIEDFLTLWQFLGWITESEPGPDLLAALEENGLTPVDPGFAPAARQAVVDLGIVRRRKVDVAADIPARRIADLPVELDGALGRSVREAERALARRLVSRYESAVAARAEREGGRAPTGIDAALVRKVASWERKDASEQGGGENVFSMMRRIGQAKAALSADYTAQLARNVGKVVLFAKHIDVMDVAESAFRTAGVRFRSIRGDQTKKARDAAIDDFTSDPDVAVIVCSLAAAGVGINLQVASNVVLAELSWTAAEQTQAIDRVHRIGQDMPVTAWRIIAAKTLDARIAELLDDKAGLAARALDGSDEEVGSSVDVQLEALVSLLTDALTEKATPVAFR